MGQNRVGREEEEGRVKTGPKRLGVKPTLSEGKMEIESHKSHLQPCKEPSGDGQ